MYQQGFHELKSFTTQILNSEEQSQLNVVEWAEKMTQELRAHIKYLNHLQGTNFGIVASTISKLLTELDKRIGINPVSSKIIYRHHPHNPTSFHRYLEGRKKMLLLIELENDHIIGAYLEANISKQPPEHSELQEQALMFSLRKESYFTLKPNARSYIYDESRLRIGNNDIVLSPQELTLHSNFCSESSAFEAEEAKLSSLVGDDQRDHKVKQWEIH